MAKDVLWKIRWRWNWWRSEGLRRQHQYKHFYRMTGLHRAHVQSTPMSDDEIIATQMRRIVGLRLQLTQQSRGYQRKIARLEKQLSAALAKADEIAALSVEGVGGSVTGSSDAALPLSPSLVAGVCEPSKGKQRAYVDLYGELADLTSSLEALIAESDGVYGLHQSGDPAPWSEITQGGRFEDWLIALSAARTAVDRETAYRVRPEGALWPSDDDAADAARYRHLKEHCSYYYAEDYVNPQPREFGIQWEHQDSTPARPCMDWLIDQEIAAKIREDDECRAEADVWDAPEDADATTPTRDGEGEIDCEAGNSRPDPSIPEVSDDH